MMKRERPALKDVRPSDDLELMVSYWKTFQDGQDSIIMCLEI